VDEAAEAYFRRTFQSLELSEEDRNKYIDECFGGFEEYIKPDFSGHGTDDTLDIKIGTRSLSFPTIGVSGGYMTLKR
jgi:hypothetical protein